MTKFFKEKEVAERFNISRSSIKNYVRNGVMPAPKKIGGSRRWSEEQLQEFEQSL